MLNLVILGGFCKSTASLTPKFYYVISVSIVSFPRSFKVQERYVAHTNLAPFWFGLLI